MVFMQELLSFPYSTRNLALWQTRKISKNPAPIRPELSLAGLVRGLDPSFRRGFYILIKLKFHLYIVPAWQS